jgi:hypothetical protein
MNFRLTTLWRHVVIFVLVFFVECGWSVVKYRNSEPQVGDAAEVHNIAYSLAHGRGYRFDWDDASWRKLWQQQNVDGRFDFIVVRRGSFATLSRPPLMPVLVAGVIRVFPRYSFLAWRVVDSSAFAAAGCLLCDVAFVQTGVLGLGIMLLMVLSDPWRREFVPGWWTEGLAFDLISVIVWLMAGGRRLAPRRFVLMGGVSVALLCLDRSIFVLLLPMLGALLGISYSRRVWLAIAVLILVVAAAIQSPWWIRNLVVSQRFLPLGTQGGINLPDEYGDAAIRTNGVWTGKGMRDAWAMELAHNEGGSAGGIGGVGLPKGMSERDVAKLWPFDLKDREAQALIAAMFCRSTASELAVSEAGERYSVRWIGVHYAKIPRLMVAKAWSLTRYLRIPLGIAGVLSVLGFIGLGAQRRLILLAAGLMGVYLVAIMLTHVVNVRFMVPIFPAIYLTTTLGVVWVVQRIFQSGQTPSKTSVAGPVM